MISFTTTANLIQRMRGARDVELSAYILRSEPMLRALESAAEHGSRVTVRLEASPYADRDGRLAKANRDSISKLRAAGVNARLVDRSGRRPNHLKAAIIDGVGFLDDRNWPVDRRNAVVADDDPVDVRAVRSAMHGRASTDGAVALTKKAALSQEGVLLSSAGRGRSAVCVETESFTAGTAPYAAMKKLTQSGVRVRLLISQNDAKETTLSAARALAREGVDIRLTHAADKFAVAGKSAWIGSANATYGRGDQLDWGIDVNGARLSRELQSLFDSTWRHAKPLGSGTPKSSRAFSSVTATRSASGL